MTVRVTYSTKSWLDKDGKRPGEQCERSFATEDEAMGAPFPDGHTFAFIPVENGRHVYHSAKFGWEFHQKK